jgi:hypothetical protein
MLGKATPVGLPNDIFASGSARWLGVQPLIDSEPEQSRTMLMSVPYSEMSGDAQTLGGNLPSSFLQTGASGSVANSQLANNSITVNTGPGLTGGGVVPLGGSITLNAVPSVAGGGMASLNANANYLTKFVDASTMTNSSLSEDSSSINSAKVFQANAGIAGGSGRVGVDSDAFGINSLFNYKYHLVNPAADANFTAMQTSTLFVESAIDHPEGDYYGQFSQAVIPAGQGFNFDFLSAGWALAEARGTGNSNGVYGFSGVSQAHGGMHNSVVGLSGTGALSETANVVTSVSGVEGMAQLNNGNATVPNAIGLHALSTYRYGSGTITNNYGLMVEDQTVGVSNYAIKTGLGQVQFGDRTILAPSTVNAASLNISAGLPPSSPVAGDIWSTATGLQYFDGGATQTIAFAGSGSSSNSGTASTPTGVASVALNAPIEFTVSNSPVTSTGALTLTKAVQTANWIYAGPSSGSSAQPFFRPLASADMPSSVLQNGSVPANTITLSGMNLDGENCTGIPADVTYGNQFLAEPFAVIAGVQPFMVVMISPAGPLNSGWNHYTWSAYVSSVGIVAIHVCNPTAIPVTTAGTQTFNLRVIQ